MFVCLFVFRLSRVLAQQQRKRANVPVIQIFKARGESRHIYWSGAGSQKNVSLLEEKKQLNLQPLFQRSGRKTVVKNKLSFSDGAITPRAFAGEYIGGERLLPLILMNAPAPLAAAVAFITLSVSIICRHAAVIASNGRPWLPRLNKKRFFFPFPLLLLFVRQERSHAPPCRRTRGRLFTAGRVVMRRPCDVTSPFPVLTPPIATAVSPFRAAQTGKSFI